MTFEDYRKEATKGNLQIGISSSVARNFFLQANIKSLQRKFGGSFLFEKNIVSACNLSALLFLLLNTVLYLVAIKWWSIIVIPLTFYFFLICEMLAFKGENNFKISSWIIIIAISGAFAFSHHGIVVVLWIVSIPLPNFFLYVSYFLASKLLKDLSVKNKNLYEWLKGEEYLYIF
ncbi:hypothetical protein BKP35_06450 [Anaerobacillus arseniciselenatis]|uniref:Uncharacterized protein n=1 Tax=Anaerobacillus arseniciselenatis TaxID=85682 RepID=A0A1S2LT29_9BACI|nr:hypothetical protein [Anaerobacillus arseniciselenatis]OIJ14515.1 hypothetical protein BKP35_06450 [Anaerobacillus arseniciselenatis]